MGANTKKNPTIIIEAQIDDKGDVKGVKIESKGFDFLEMVAVLEMAKINLVQGQVKADTKANIYLK